MYEIELAYKTDNSKRLFVYGYSVADAFRRKPELNPDEWEIWYKEYID